MLLNFFCKPPQWKENYFAPPSLAINKVIIYQIVYVYLFWLNVKCLISFDQRVMTYKILHGLCTDNLHHKFVERSMISEYGTRNRRDFANS